MGVVDLELRYLSHNVRRDETSPKGDLGKELEGMTRFALHSLDSPSR